MDVTDRDSQAVYDLLKENFFDARTHLIYDLRTTTEKDGAIRDLPTPKEIARHIPNPNGWHTGMEDSMLNGGYLFDALLLRAGRTGEPWALDFMREVLEGIYLCSTISSDKGLLARSVSPVDGKSYYIDSSRDQYTHVVWSLTSFFDSGFATEDDRQRIASILASFSDRAFANATPEHDFNLLRADGGRGMVMKIWGSVAGHECLRLPMIYLAAFHVTGDETHLTRYKAVRDKGIEMTSSMPQKQSRTFIYTQSQLSARLLYKYETDETYRGKYLDILRFTCASLPTDTAPKVMNDIESGHDYNVLCPPWRTLPMTYRLGAPLDGVPYFFPERPAAFEEGVLWAINNLPDCILTRFLCPGMPQRDDEAAALDALLCAIDFTRHGSASPVRLLCAYEALQYENISNSYGERL